jgi:GxxExxY protein
MTGGNTECTENTEVTENAGHAGRGTDSTGLMHEDLTGAIRQTAFDVHRYFGPEFLEKVYERSLANRLLKQGCEVAMQFGIPVRDEDGTLVGEYVADLLVARTVIIEVKAVSQLTDDHRAQVLSYLRATGMRVGMLLNFGQRRLQVKRFAL